MDAVGDENRRYEYVQNLIPTPGSSTNKLNFRKRYWGKIENVHQLFRVCQCFCAFVCGVETQETY